MSACLLARHRSVGPGDFDRRLRTLLDLVPVVFVEALCQNQSLLFHLDVFIQADKIGIQARNTGYRVHKLLSKNKVGDFLAVLCDTDVSLVQAGAKALEQRLRNREAEARGYERIVAVAAGVSRIPAIVEVDAELGPRRETYINPGVCVYVILGQPVGTREIGTEFGSARVLPFTTPDKIGSY